MSVKDYDKLMSNTVKPLYEKWKRTAARENILRPQIVYGYFPCQSKGNSLLVYDEKQKNILQTFRFPRQKNAPHLCLADFFAPVKSKKMDVLPIMMVTMGAEASRQSKKAFDSDKYNDFLYLHGLSVETAEALAEYWHQRIRAELGITKNDSPHIPDLFKLKYQGCRYSFGYPACPDLEDQAKMQALLSPHRIGVTLSEGFQLIPEQSTSAVIMHHPQAKYFNVN